MNKIEKLVSQLCPSGVIHIPLGEIVEVLNGYAFKSSKYSESGVRVIRISNVQKGKIVDADPKFYPLSSIDEIDRFMLEEGDLLLSLTGNVGRVGQIPSSLLPAGLNQRVACLRVRNSKKLSLRYLYHLLDDSKFEKDCLLAANGSAQANLSTEWLKGYFVSLPPLQVQEEIVRILDTFSELEAELEAELVARKTQYEYFRNSLFPVTRNSDTNFRWKRMSDLCYRKSGLALTASQMRTMSDPLGDVRIFAGGQTVADVRASQIGGKYIEGPGLIVKSRGIIDFDYWIGRYSHKNELWSYQPKSEAVNLKYLFYFLKSNVGAVRETAKANSVKMPQIKVGDIDNFLIPVPSIERQLEIVRMLDAFSTLVEDRQFGLPAEISAHRLQYEYYRSKLLTFKEQEVA